MIISSVPGRLSLANVRSRISGSTISPSSARSSCLEIALIPLVIVLKNLHLSYTVWGSPRAYRLERSVRDIPLHRLHEEDPEGTGKAAIIDRCGMFRTYYHIYLP
jgi:ABC-type glycerol-3-phosphate transport system permease component